jgi:hypothetical protein
VRNLKLSSVYFLIFLAAASCAKNGASTSTGLPALPQSWIGGPGGDETPSDEVTKSVRNSFQVHADALETADLRSNTPWHLDGMITSFAVDTEGIFGSLVGEGKQAVKVTWQKSDSLAPAKAKRTSVKFNANMSNADLARMIEPAVKMAVANHSVKDSTNLRRNLLAMGEKFLSNVRALSHVPAVPGWTVHGMQMDYHFDADGDLGNNLSVGGGIAVYYDWSAPTAPELTKLPALTPHEKVVAKNMADFVRIMSTLVVQASADAGDIQKAGYDFMFFDVGLGFSAGGGVIVGGFDAGCDARIQFMKDPELTAVPLALNPGDKLVMQKGGDEIPIDLGNFRDGLRKALKMGAYFSNQAHFAKSSSWVATELEVNFDAGLGGDISITSLLGKGLLRMDFERVD